jgi:hypothetical protein
MGSIAPPRRLFECRQKKFSSGVAKELQTITLLRAKDVSDRQPGATDSQRSPMVRSRRSSKDLAAINRGGETFHKSLGPVLINDLSDR